MRNLSTLALIAVACAAQSADHYKIQVLNPLPGDLGAVATDINDQGVIVGGSSPSGSRFALFGISHPVIWKNFSAQALPIGGFNGVAYGVSDNYGLSGQKGFIYGRMYNGDNGSYALFRLQDGGTYQTLSRTGSFGTFGRGVANDGSILGSYSSQKDKDKLYGWFGTDTAGTRIGTEDGLANIANPEVINSIGDITGFDWDSNVSIISGLSKQSYLYKNGDFRTDFTKPAGADQARVKALNNSGTALGIISYSANDVAIVKWSYKGSGNLISREQAAWTQLYRGFASPVDFNDAGTVIANLYGVDWFSAVGGQASAGGVIEKGAFIDLNTLIAPSDPLYGKFVLYAVTGLNSQGQIIGYGSVDGSNTVPVLLTPAKPSLGLNLTFQDYSAAASKTGIPVTIDLRTPGTSTVVKSYSVFPNSAGHIDIEVPAEGTYDVAVKASHWLRRVTKNVNVSFASASPLAVSLVNGDVDGNNVITLVDSSRINAAFRARVGSANWDPMADLNGDGVVSAADLAIFNKNYRAAGDR